MLVDPLLLVAVTVILMVKLPRLPQTPEQVGPVHPLEKPPDQEKVVGVGESNDTLQYPPPVPLQFTLLMIGGAGAAETTALYALRIPVPIG